MVVLGVYGDLKVVLVSGGGIGWVGWCFGGCSWVGVGLGQRGLDCRWECLEGSLVFGVLVGPRE